MIGLILTRNTFASLENIARRLLSKRESKITRFWRKKAICLLVLFFYYWKGYSDCQFITWFWDAVCLCVVPKDLWTYMFCQRDCREQKIPLIDPAHYVPCSLQNISWFTKINSTSPPEFSWCKYLIKTIDCCFYLSEFTAFF